MLCHVKTLFEILSMLAVICKNRDCTIYLKVEMLWH